MSQIGEIKKLSDTRFLNFYEFEAVHRDGTSAPFILSLPGQRKSSSSRPFLTRTSPTASFFSAYTERKRTELSSSASTVTRWGITSTNSPPVWLKAAKTWQPPVSGKCTRKPGLPLPRWTQAPVPGRFHHHRHDRRKLRHRIRLLQRRTNLGASGVVGGHSGDPRRPGGCRRILREENVAIMCAYMLMHFIAGEGDPLAFLQNE